MNKTYQHEKKFIPPKKWKNIKKKCFIRLILEKRVMAKLMYHVGTVPKSYFFHTRTSTNGRGHLNCQRWTRLSSFTPFVAFDDNWCLGRSRAWKIMVKTKMGKKALIKKRERENRSNKNLKPRKNMVFYCVRTQYHGLSFYRSIANLGCLDPKLIWATLA